MENLDIKSFVAMATALAALINVAIAYFVNKKVINNRAYEFQNERASRLLDILHEYKVANPASLSTNLIGQKLFSNNYDEEENNKRKIEAAKSKEDYNHKMENQRIYYRRKERAAIELRSLYLVKDLWCPILQNIIEDIGEGKLHSTKLDIRLRKVYQETIDVGLSKS